MVLKCLNCRKPVDVEDHNVGRSFSCDNCKVENFAAYFGTPLKAVYFKVRKEDGEMIIYGNCKNEECDGHCVDNSVFKDAVMMTVMKPTNQIPGRTDCPECGTPGRPILTTLSQS